MFVLWSSDEAKGGCFIMGSLTMLSSAGRLTSTLNLLSDIATGSRCRHCEILATCLRHLQEDASAQAPSVRRRLFSVLRHLAPTSYRIRRRFQCQRCLPAEIFAAYLTREEQIEATVDNERECLA
jgi:hypothetical protein